MARVLVLFVHPGQRHSRVNVAMAKVAKSVDRVTFVDLYADYPTFNIDIDFEQARLQAHDVIVFQFPIYWYSTPALLKEWQDLVLEYGFAYGHNGDKLKGKIFLPVVTAGGPQDAYGATGRNHFSLRTLLSPLEQTANLCQMRYIPPLVLFSAHDSKNDGRAERHLSAYRTLLESLRDDHFHLERALQSDLLDHENLPIHQGEER
ncbi:NAD(P)H-dependent oxidoreductase [Rhizobium sp. 2YAF20]|uniref:NAD(P)H-dependent oxidoreductase n=1 Tax=Rhizobium sp. 2YAF20 TaxID=3233027 RepID=UPI003F94B76F